MEYNIARTINCFRTLNAAETVCPGNQTVYHVGEIKNDLLTQLKGIIQTFTCFSVELDDNTDESDTAQLLIFIRGVNNSEIISRLPLLKLCSLKCQDLYQYSKIC